jgi:hypothetical protein
MVWEPMSYNCRRTGALLLLAPCLSRHCHFMCLLDLAHMRLHSKQRLDGC